MWVARRKADMILSNNNKSLRLGIDLGGTEIFLLISQADRPDFLMFDTTALHARRAVEVALGES
jgi:aspartate/glutamate racemase